MPYSLEERILNALWHWKLLPLAAIAEQFFGCQYSDAAYKRMRGLRKKGLVEPIHLKNFDETVWTLSTKGFEAIRYILPELREVGFRSESPTHDFLCSALQRGPWLSAVPQGVTLISEQQLRRCHPEHLDQWIPRSDLHRSDGFTIRKDGDEADVTAIEVELNKKAPADYARVSSFYSPDEVTRVLWMVPNQAFANWLLHKLSEFHPERRAIHQLVLLPDFLQDFWEASVSLGHETGRHIHQLLGQPASPTLLTGEKPAMLDLRRRPYTSIIYDSTPDRNFLNRVALRAPSSPSLDIAHFPASPTNQSKRCTNDQTSPANLTMSSSVELRFQTEDQHSELQVERR